MAIGKNNYVGQVEGGELASVRVADFEEPDVGSRSFFGGFSHFTSSESHHRPMFWIQPMKWWGLAWPPERRSAHCNAIPPPLLPSWPFGNRCESGEERKERREEKTQRKWGGNHRVFFPGRKPFRYLQCNFLVFYLRAPQDESRPCSIFDSPTLRGQPSRFFPLLSINSRSLETLTNLSTAKTRMILCHLVGLHGLLPITSS